MATKKRVRVDPKRPKQRRKRGKGKSTKNPCDRCDEVLGRQGEERLNESVHATRWMSAPTRRAEIGKSQVSRFLSLRSASYALENN